MKTRTPAKRLHELARKLGLEINEFSPGLRVWSITKGGDYANPLAFGVLHAEVEDRLLALASEPLRVKLTPGWGKAWGGQTV